MKMSKQNRKCICIKEFTTHCMRKQHNGRKKKFEITTTTTNNHHPLHIYLKAGDGYKISSSTILCVCVLNVGV